jgi:hypothetical protein
MVRFMDPGVPSRSSMVTVPEPRVEAVSAAGGGVVVRAEPLLVKTGQRVELVDLTERVGEMVRRSGVREGLASVWSMHTTCALSSTRRRPRCTRTSSGSSRRSSRATPPGCTTTRSTPTAIA